MNIHKHEVSIAIEKLGGDKVLGVIESLYQEGLDYLNTDDLADYQQGWLEALAILRKELLVKGGKA